MHLHETPSQAVRLPADAVEALHDGRPVAITRYGRRQFVVLTQEQFAAVRPLLELLEEGAAVSPELLMSSDDVALSRALAADAEVTPEEADHLRAFLGR